MVLNPLRLFHEVARTGSIRKASEVLKLAPSSVSRQVLILERQIGTTLLDRSAAGVALTPAGQLVAKAPHLIAPPTLNLTDRQLGQVRMLVAQQIAVVAAQLVLLVVIAAWLPGLPRRTAGMAGFLRFGRDNLLLSWMHGRLMVEFVLRLPGLAWRKLRGAPPFQP